nr:FecR domain-containing protein [uncultured Allomuricauda sp.]
MISRDIKKRIVKYLTNEANSAELDFLSKWIENSDNEKLFETYVKTHYEVRLAMSKPDMDSIKRKLSQKIKKDKNPFYKYKIGPILKYAAVIALIFGIGYLYQKIDVSNDQESLQENLLIPKEEAITIQLDNGSLQTIDLDEEKKIKDSKGNLIGVQNKAQLKYDKSPYRKELVYNTLNVPNGKRVDVILSDGTHVFLNSGTSLRYPINFVKGIQRTVYLTGEAYFDVTEDKDHPFVVHADEMRLKVLGTKFNISHYSEDQNVNTVLVTGSVELYHNESTNGNPVNTTVLKPGFKAEWGKSNKEITIENVDTRIYTAWTEGKLIFRNASFLKIRNTLERHYNVVINNTNEDLDAQLFDATFDIETITEVLQAFSKSYAIEYSIVNNEVFIN